MLKASPTNSSFIYRVWRGFLSYIFCASVSIAPFAVLYIYIAYFRNTVRGWGEWAEVIAGCVYVLILLFFLRGLSFGVRDTDSKP